MNYYICRIMVWTQNGVTWPYESMTLSCSECRMIADSFRAMGMAAWPECFVAFRF